MFTPRGPPELFDTDPSPAVEPDLMRAAAAALSRPELADAVPVIWEAALRLAGAASPE